MPKAILEFNLPDDNEDFTLATRGKNYYCALHDIFNMLRDVWKYDNSLDDEQHEIIDKIYTQFHEIAGEYLEDVS